VLDLGVRVVLEPDPGQKLQGASLGGGPVDGAAPGRLVAEEDVLGDGQLGDECELLMNDDDASRLTRADVLELHVLAPGNMMSPV